MFPQKAKALCLQAGSPAWCQWLRCRPAAGRLRDRRQDSCWSPPRPWRSKASWTMRRSSPARCRTGGATGRRPALCCRTGTLDPVIAHKAEQGDKTAGE